MQQAADLLSFIGLIRSLVQASLSREATYGRSRYTQRIRCELTNAKGKYVYVCGQMQSETPVVREPGGPTVHPPQEPSTMVPKCTLGCPEHNLTCSPDSHWDALELQPFAQGYPLEFTRVLTERRSLMHHLNHLYIFFGDIMAQMYVKICLVIPFASLRTNRH